MDSAVAAFFFFLEGHKKKNVVSLVCFIMSKFQGCKQNTQRTRSEAFRKIWLQGKRVCIPLGENFPHLGNSVDILFVSSKWLGVLYVIFVTLIEGLVRTFLHFYAQRLKHLCMLNSQLLVNILPAFTCSKLTIEILEQGVKYAQS